MKLEKLLPEVYYKESRDFAFIARLIEIYINYMKSAADNVDFKMNKSTLNSYVLQLVANNLGFKLKHNYENKDLMYLCTTLMSLYRKKGSIQAIIDAIQLLVNSQKIDEKISRDNVTITNDELEIRIPSALTDVTLLEDVFDYILPAGMTYTFIRVYNAKESDKLYNVSTYKDNTWSKQLSYSDEYSGLYEIQDAKAKTNEDGISGYLGNIGSSIVANAGISINPKTNTSDENTPGENPTEETSEEKTKEN